MSFDLKFVGLSSRHCCVSFQRENLLSVRKYWRTNELYNQTILYTVNKTTKTPHMKHDDVFSPIRLLLIQKKDSQNHCEAQRNTIYKTTNMCKKRTPFLFSLWTDIVMCISCTPQMGFISVAGRTDHGNNKSRRSNVYAIVGKLYWFSIPIRLLITWQFYTMCFGFFS